MKQRWIYSLLIIIITISLILAVILEKKDDALRLTTTAAPLSTSPNTTAPTTQSAPTKTTITSVEPTEDSTPKLTVEVSNLFPVNGEVITISVRHPRPKENFIIETPFSPYLTMNPDKDADKFVAYVPVPVRQPLGTYAIKLISSIEGPMEQITIEVSPYDFKVQHITITETVSNAHDTSEAWAEYNRIYWPKRLQSNKSSYIDAPFVIPHTGTLTTEFGERRTVNEKQTSYRHLGLDLSGDIGMPVVATNTGKILLADFIPVTGGTILIDHGQGIMSTYAHLNAIHVKEGDMVECSQHIADIGTTGFSTGAHLHFGICIWNVDIDPGYFIYGVPVTKENYLTLFEED